MTAKRVPSWLTAVVVVVVVALSAVAWWVTHNGVDHQDHALLKEDTSQAVLRLQTNVEQVSLGLGSVGVEAKVFDKQAEAMRTRPGITVALVSKGRVADAHGDIAPGPPQVVQAVGPALQKGEQLPEQLAQIALAAHSALSASPVIDVAGSPSEVFSIVPPSIGLPGYVALQVNDIAPGPSAGVLDVGVGLAQLSAPAAPFHQLDLAVYATPTPQRNELLASTVGGKALPRPTASAELNVGSVQWDVEGAARAPLLDSYARATPWIVLGVGLLLALGLAITVETLANRQRYTATVVAQREAELLEAHDALVREEGHAATADEKYQHQRAVSEALQHSLLPRTVPDIPGIEVAARYIPGTVDAEVGGDWYSIIVVDDDRFVFVVGDVSGHDIGAAGTMASLRYTMRAFASLGFTPEEILERADREIDVMDGGRFATVVVGSVSLSAGELVIASAGHPPPYLVHGDAGAFVKLEAGAPLGVGAPTPLPTTVGVPAGSTLIVFSDGLVERRGAPIDQGLESLGEVARQGPRSAEELLAHIVDAFTSDGHEDDIVIMVINFVGVGAPACGVTDGEASATGPVV